MPDRARRVVPGAVPPPNTLGHAPSPMYHPLQALWAFRGPLRCTWGFLARAGWVPGIALPLPTRYTHPVPIPTPVHPAGRSAHYTYTVLGTAVLGTV